MLGFLDPDMVKHGGTGCKKCRSCSRNCTRGGGGGSKLARFRQVLDNHVMFRSKVGNLDRTVHTFGHLKNWQVAAI